MAKILNIHRRDTPNRGDLASGPHNYFADQHPLEISGWKSADKKKREKWFSEYDSADLIVLGGGGLLEFPKYEDSVRFVGSLPGKKKVIWGAGHNVSGLTGWSRLKPVYSSDYADYSLVGVRDFGHQYEWVPCASCMDSAFDKSYEITEEFVFFANMGSKDSVSYIPEEVDRSEVVGNLKTPMSDIIAELAKAETVITSSYHGAYWATLLGRKVVGIPTSSKFYDLRHPIPICHRTDWRRYLNLARSYDGALEECRAANTSFHERVMNLI